MTKNLFKNKKSQITLEYMVTYAWAILVVILIIAILFYFGVWNIPGPKKCIIATGLACYDISVKTDEVQIGLFHNLGRSITIDNIELDDCPNPPPVNPPLPQSMEKKQKIIFTIGSCAITGKKYSSELKITYTNLETGLRHTMSGEIKSPVNT